MQNPLTKRLEPAEGFFDRFNAVPGDVSASTLKLVAVITMTLDHFAAGVLYFQLLTHALPSWLDFDTGYTIYMVLRGIGRTAFPIYCFLIVEGLMHTRSRARYLLRLVLFAFLSEIPFDLIATQLSDPASADIPQLLADNREAIFEHQNVFFTLAIGLAAIWAIEAIRTRFGTCLVTLVSAAVISIAAYHLADFLKTDYEGVGVCVILVFYLFYPIRIAAGIMGFLGLTGRLSTAEMYYEEWAFPAFFLMLFYNGKRGFLGRSKAVSLFFYLFYPAHLFLWFLTRVLLLRLFL
ncbi:MAG: conjugal transfer protein TraX [Lachnospiraceae bacterium]|nr:conjugal transfer protein TraX [Lachnospiraceae bacterium]